MTTTDHPGSGPVPTGEGGTARTPGAQDPEPGCPGLGGVVGVRDVRADPLDGIPPAVRVLRRTDGEGCARPRLRTSPPHRRTGPVSLLDAMAEETWPARSARTSQPGTSPQPRR
jgi:hypothetical protein